MEGRIGPDNDTLVSFLDMDGDPNEGHNEEETTPQLDTKAANPPAAEGEGPETVVDMTDAATSDADGDPPTENQPPAEEEQQDEPPAEEQEAEEEQPQAAAEPAAEKKKTPWQRTNEPSSLPVSTM